MIFGWAVLFKTEADRELFEFLSKPDFAGFSNASPFHRLNSLDQPGRQKCVHPARPSDRAGRPIEAEGVLSVRRLLAATVDGRRRRTGELPEAAA